MSERFKNITFVIMVFLCCTTTIITTYSSSKNEKVIQSTFDSLTAQTERSNQISFAQEYATLVGQVAVYEAMRSYQLEQQLQTTTQLLEKSTNDLKEAQLINTLDAVSISVLNAYIDQLTKVLKDNNISVPEPDLSNIKEDMPPEFDPNQPDIDIEIEVPEENSNDSNN